VNVFKLIEFVINNVIVIIVIIKVKKKLKSKEGSMMVATVKNLDVKKNIASVFK